MIISRYYCNSNHWPRRISKIKKIYNKTIKQKDLNFKKNYNYFLNLVLTNDKEIKKLNFKYNNKKKPTDVLTFVSKVKNKHLGKDAFCDIFFSAETLLKDSKRNKINFYDHFTHIFVHSCLHINGFRHNKTKDFEIMKNLEIKILKNLGINKPY